MVSITYSIVFSIISPYKFFDCKIYQNNSGIAEAVGGRESEEIRYFYTVVVCGDSMLLLCFLLGWGGGGGVSSMYLPVGRY